VLDELEESFWLVDVLLSWLLELTVGAVFVIVFSSWYVSGTFPFAGAVWELSVTPLNNNKKGFFFFPQDVMRNRIKIAPIKLNICFFI
jgi:hypothetical protein